MEHLRIYFIENAEIRYDWELIPLKKVKSICQLFCHILSHLAVCHTVTLHTASKMNQGHNK